MKIASKIIFWVLSIVCTFILVNLLIGLIKYKSVDAYTSYLNEKDWSETLSQVSITKPQSIFSIFYGNYVPTEKVLKDTSDKDIVNTSKIDLFDTKDLGEQEFDPYDPKHQDDFENFFGDSTSSLNDSDDNVQAGFITDKDVSISKIQDQTTTKTVGQELLEKFSQ